MNDRPFWRVKTPGEMTLDEWESLCDGCAKCCLIKLQDVDGEEVEYTDVVCRYLDLDACRCDHYAERREVVPECLVLNPRNFRTVRWLPSTCAYRLIAEGRDLAWWHPLVSGDPETVHRAGVSVRHKVIHEFEVRDEDLEDHIIDTP